jgi:hypothetical protein
MKLSPQALAAAEAQFPQQTAAIKNVAAQVGAVSDAAQASIGAGANAIGALASQAKAMVGAFPLINSDYWNLAKTFTGGQFATGSYFLDLARGAANVSELQDLAGAVPWYGVGFLHFGATIRAAELAQNDAIAASLVKFHASSSYMGSESSSSKAAHFSPLPPVPSPDATVKKAKAAATVTAHAGVVVVAAGGLGLAWLLGFL